MSRAINTPVNQKRTTNISIVRLNKKGKKFEIACYKNKVEDWRCLRETDLSEVLQVSDKVFTNVSKGETASNKILQSSFGSSDVKSIIDEILSKGTIQVSEKERAEHKNNLFNEIATLISKNCYDPATEKPHSVDYIISAMKNINCAPKLNKPAKAQFNEVLKNLQTHEKGIQIKRANMKIELTLPSTIYNKNKTQLLDLLIKPEVSYDGSNTSMLSEVLPGNVKILYDISDKLTKGKNHPKVLSLREVSDDPEFKFS